METRFRKTKNPLLIARCERKRRSTTTLAAVRDARGRHHSIADAVSAFRTAPFADPAATTPTVGSPGISETLIDSDEPLEAALDLIMQRTKAKNAFLYVLDGSDLRLAWSSTNDEPPGSQVAELGRWLDVARDNAPHHDTRRGREASSVQAVTVSGYRLVALPSPTERAIVGGIILEGEPSLELVDVTHVFDALGRVIQERGLDTIGFITV